MGFAFAFWKPHPLSSLKGGSIRTVKKVKCLKADRQSDRKQKKQTVRKTERYIDRQIEWQRGRCRGGVETEEVTYAHFHRHKPWLNWVCSSWPLFRCVCVGESVSPVILSVVPWAVAEQTQSTPTHLCGPPSTVRPGLDTGLASPLNWARAFSLCVWVCIVCACAGACVQVCPWKNQKPLQIECISMRGRFSITLACTCVFVMLTRLKPTFSYSYSIFPLWVIIFCWSVTRIESKRWVYESMGMCTRPLPLLTSGHTCTPVNHRHLPSKASAVLI